MRGPQNEEHAAGDITAQMAAAANAGLGEGGGHLPASTRLSRCSTLHMQRSSSSGGARLPRRPAIAAAILSVQHAPRRGTAPGAAAAERGTAAACSNSHLEGCRCADWNKLRSWCKLMLTRNASCFGVTTNESRGIESRLWGAGPPPATPPAAQAQTQLQRSLLQVCIIPSSTVEHASLTSFMPRHQQPDALGGQVCIVQHGSCFESSSLVIMMFDPSLGRTVHVAI